VQIWTNVKWHIFMAHPVCYLLASKIVVKVAVITGDKEKKEFSCGGCLYPLLVDATVYAGQSGVITSVSCIFGPHAWASPPFKMKIILSCHVLIVC